MFKTVARNMGPSTGAIWALQISLLYPVVVLDGALKFFLLSIFILSSCYTLLLDRIILRPYLSWLNVTRFQVSPAKSYKR